jgi:type II secretory pathway component GspD/PulD (secretin)
MSRVLFLLLLLPFHAFAGISIELRDASIPMFLQTVVRGVLGRDFVVSSDVPAEKKISVFIKNMEADNAAALALDLLRSQGLSVEEKHGIFFVGVVAGASSVGTPSPAVEPSKPDTILQAPPVPLEWVIYRPRNRSAAFIREVAQAAGGKVSGFAQNHAQGVFPVQPMQGQPYGQNYAPVAYPVQAQGIQTTQGAGASDMVVFGIPEDRKDKLLELIESVDLPLPAVSIRAVLLEVSNNDDSNRSLSGVLSLLGGRLGIQLEAGSPASNAVSIRSTSLNAVLSAVDGDSRFRYLSEPRLSVVSGETATLTVGSDVPVRGAVSLDGNGNALQSVDYRTGGLTLSVTPQVFLDSVLLRIDQQVSSFANTTTSTIDSPTLLKRKLTTNVRARDTDLVFLAGLDESRDSESSSGVSFLPKWLHSLSASKGRSQLVLLLEVRRLPATTGL